MIDKRNLTSPPRTKQSTHYLVARPTRHHSPTQALFHLLQKKTIRHHMVQHTRLCIKANSFNHPMPRQNWSDPSHCLLLRHYRLLLYHALEKRFLFTSVSLIVFMSKNLVFVSLYCFFLFCFSTSDGLYICPCAWNRWKKTTSSQERVFVCLWFTDASPNRRQ